VTEPEQTVREYEIGEEIEFLNLDKVWVKGVIARGWKRDGVILVYSVIPMPPTGKALPIGPAHIRKRKDKR